MEKKLAPALRNAFVELPNLYAALPENPDQFFQEFRSFYAKRRETMVLPVNESVSVTDRFIPGPEGAPEIRVRIYTPVSKNTELPALLWIHGGGYIVGFPEQNEGLCQRFVTDANCIVVSVDYRLAPEHPYPAALEDCYAALEWLYKNAEEIGVDSSRLAVAGNSAGGGLTAAVALLARDRKGPPIAFQMPLYPMIDDRHTTPSSYEITDPKVWNRYPNMLGYNIYLGSNSDKEVSPYAAPSRATDLSGLPPTYTCIGSLDPLRDETIDFVMRLNQSGVPTEFHVYPGCFHGFESIAPQTEISKRAEDGYIQALKRAMD